MKPSAAPADEVSLQQFRALASIAQTGSFTLAADALQLTQPAVSHLIKRMEQQLGQPLVVRGRRIRLTDAGQMMADTAQRALRMIDESVHACRSQAQLQEGRVVVAVGHLTAGALLPALLARFSKAHPQLVATLHDSNAAQMVAQVTGFQGRIATDPSKPDGTPRKLMDVSRLAQMGWRASISLQDGLTATYRWFLTHSDSFRR